MMAIVMVMVTTMMMLIANTFSGNSYRGKCGHCAGRQK